MDQSADYITKEKRKALEVELENLKGPKRKEILAALEYAKSLGDLSENAAYSIAKGKVRGMHQRIHDLEQQIKTATVITSQSQRDRVEVGSRVTIEMNGKRHTYRILGSSETRPESGVISHVSPLGQALIGKKIGDTVNVKLSANKEFKTTIIDMK